MKDKLRELVGELMSACEMIGYATSGNERANHRATRDKAKAELLAILNAEGDGGAVGDGLRALLGEKKLYVMRPEHVQDEHLPLHEISFGMVLDDKVLFTSQNTPPARSGVVSDEDVEAACAIYFGGQHWPHGVEEVELVRISMRAALEHFAKGERHER